MTVDTSRNYETLVGRDGWLFMTKIDGLFEKHRGEITLSEAELRQWQLTLELRRGWLNYRGIKYAFVVAPNKASIYTEFLPDGYPISDKRPLMVLKDYLARNSDFRIIDPADHLRAQKGGKRELYYRTDEHWNDVGAFKAYQYILRQLPGGTKLDAVDRSRLEEKPRNFVGELAAVLPTPYQEKSFQVSIAGAQSSLAYRNKPKGRGTVEVRLSKNTALPKAVMFRDSFASALLPYVAESFSRIVSVSSRQMLFDLVESEKPDIVITEMVERYLDPAPDDIKMKSFEDFCGVPLATIKDVTLKD